MAFEPLDPEAVERGRRRLEAHLRARAQVPLLERVRNYVGGITADADDVDDVVSRERRRAQLRPDSVRREVDDLDALLADPDLKPGTLSWMVAWDANWQIDNARSDEAAKAWLRDLSARIRTVLD